MHPTGNSRSWRIQEPPRSLFETKTCYGFPKCWTSNIRVDPVFFKHVPFSIEDPNFNLVFFMELSRFFFGFSAPQMGKSHAPRRLDTRPQPAQRWRAVDLGDSAASGSATGATGALTECHGLCHGFPCGKHTQNYGKSPFLMGKSTISMAIFNNYVSLPEGIHGLSVHRLVPRCPKIM